MAYKTFPLYYSYEDDQQCHFVGDAEYVTENNVDTIGLIKVDSIEFSTMSVTESDPATTDGHKTNEDDRESDTTRKATRTTYLVCQVRYEYNGEFGFVSMDLDTPLSIMTTEDDELGNPYNSEVSVSTTLLPIDSTFMDSILDNVKTALGNQVSSYLKDMREKEFLKRFVAECNRAFGNFTKPVPPSTIPE